jgi:leucine dehydrogenase
MEKLIEIDDRATGLRAVIAIDSTALGPAAGGVRTRAYPRFADAVADACALASAMTVKCALAGLDAGGGKAVVWDHGAWDREAGFARLGEAIEALGGAFRTAGDLGTTAADLAAMARRCRFVHTDEANLAGAVARGLVACVEACLARRGRGFPGLRVAVQGAGAIGGACARALAARGAAIVAADLDPARAAALGAAVLPPDDILVADADILLPCAAGGALTAAAVAAMRAWAVVPAANNAVADHEAARLLVARGILHVPDQVASAGAVIEGIGRTVMGLAPAERGRLIDRLGLLAADILERSATAATPADDVARAIARTRLKQL